MTADELRHRFEHINVWKRGDQRAPHKPLLLLYALGRCYHEDRRLLPYLEVDKQVGQLLKAFGPSRPARPNDPFWHLTNDDLWTISDVDRLERQKNRPKPLVSSLKEINPGAGFPEPIFQFLRSRPKLIGELAQTLLNAHFPSTLHTDILEAASLRITAANRSNRLPRDPEFRDRILDAYEHQCAVCGYDIRLNSQLVGLEAAHVKWHQYRGPDTEDNGLALCVVHHKLFGRGAWRITDDYKLIASDLVGGSAGLNEWLFRYHGASIAQPTKPGHRVDPEFVAWHKDEVFRGADRQYTFS